MADGQQDLYIDIADQYDAVETLPLAALQRAFVEVALGDCTGLEVLDLGGGTGTPARQALDLGAKMVDLVDISPGMMDYGKLISTQTGHLDRIRWHVGDMTKPLDHLPLEKEYDIIMVCWPFDHATTMDELEAMWRNTAVYCKKGGKLVTVRMRNPQSSATTDGKYGITFSDLEEVPGGWRYEYKIHTNPPFSCPSASMHASLDPDKASAMATKHGFPDLTDVSVKELQLVIKDPEFWKMFVDDPYFVCSVATKS